MHSLVKDPLKQLLGLDLRSLALFRICVALVILADLGLRARDLRAHYTDEGILPRVYFLLDRTRWSLHLISGSVYIQGFLFVLAAAFALCLLVGYRTRLATFLTWLLLVSLQARNWMILNSGDVVLGLMLFWSLFLPLGSRFSVDSLAGSRAEKPIGPYVSVATFGFLVQLCVIYWVPVLRRTDPAWWNGEMLYYSLNYDVAANSLGIWLREWAWPLPWLSLAVIWWEVIGPGLVWIPLYPQLWRLLAVAGFVMLHLGIALFMSIGIFPIACIVAWLNVLPGACWETLKKNRTVESIARNLKPDPFLVAKIQKLPKLLRPRPVSLQAGAWTNIAAGFFVCFVIAWNLRVLDSNESWFPRPLNLVAYVCCLSQNWNMFTPGPPRQDGWYVVSATLKNGHEVDLLTGGGPVSWEKPRLVVNTLPNHRWHRYFENLLNSPDDMHWNFFSQYIARQWNASHGPEEQLAQFTFYYMSEETLPNKIGTPQKNALWTYRSAGSLGLSDQSGRSS